MVASDVAPGFNIRQGRRVGVSSVRTMQATGVEIDHFLNGCHVTDSDVESELNIRQRRRVRVSSCEEFYNKRLVWTGVFCILD